MIVIEIGEGTFGSNHNLIEVIFGNNIKKIGPYAFYGCNNLKGDLIISDKIKEIPYLAFERCGFNGTLKIPSSVSTIQEHNFKNANFQ